jgi:hypothetical protein
MGLLRNRSQAQKTRRPVPAIQTISRVWRNFEACSSVGGALDGQANMDKLWRGRNLDLGEPHAKVIHYRRGGSSNSSFELNGLLSQCGDGFGQYASERSEKLLADSWDGLPRLGPLVWTGLCQGLWSIQVLVPPLLVK